MEKIKLPKYIMDIINEDDFLFLIEIRDTNKLREYLTSSLYTYYATKIHYNEAYKYAKCNSSHRYSVFNNIESMIATKVNRIVKSSISN